MARGAAFTDADAAISFARDLAAGGSGVVVKADGLMAGKGVFVCDGAEEAARAIEGLFAPAAGVTGAAAAAGALTAAADIAGPAVVVVEERLAGREASVIALCDGTDAVALPAARDHKRIGDGDTGPNTGGMGAYAPVPDLSADEVSAIVRDFHVPALRALAARGIPFVGALYAGLMLTPDGPALLEFNARFGDPETQVLLPLVTPTLGRLLRAAAVGDLAAEAGGAGAPPALARPGLFAADDAAAVGIVLASDGYPEAPVAGDVITGLEDAEAAGALVFHAGTERTPDGAWRTRGGRAVTVVGLGPDLAAAPGTWPSARPRSSRSGGCGDATTSARTSPGSSRCGRDPREASHDPALHAPGDGRDLDRERAVRADAPGGDRRRPRPGGARDGPAGGPRGDRGACPGGRGPDRRDREDDRPRRHRVRQPGGRVGGPRRPLHPPRPHEQRRHRHRARAPARGCRPAPPRRLRRPRGRPRPPRAGACGDRDDGPDAFGPRGAHDLRPEARRVGLRGGPRPDPSRRGRRGDRDGQDLRAGRDVQPPRRRRSRRRPSRALGLRADPVSTQIVQRDRHAALLVGDRDPRRDAGADRDRGAQPPAHRDRRGDGALPRGPEGLVGDAAQAEPDRERADRRARAPPARLRGRGPRGPAPLARAGHQPLERRAGGPPRRDDRLRLRAREDARRSWTSSSSAPTGCGRTSPPASGSTRAAASSSRSWTRASRARTRTRSSSAARCGPPTSAARWRRPSRRTATWPRSSRSRSSTRSSTTRATSSTCRRSSRASTRSSRRSRLPPRPARGRPEGRRWPLTRSSAPARSATSTRSTRTGSSSSPPTASPPSTWSSRRRSPTRGASSPGSRASGSTGRATSSRTTCSPRTRRTCPTVAGLPPRDDLRGRMMLCRRAEVLPVEIVVRGYISGQRMEGLRPDGHGLGDPAAGRPPRERPAPGADPHAVHEGGAGDPRRADRLRDTGGHRRRRPGGTGPRDRARALRARGGDGRAGGDRRRGHEVRDGPAARDAAS